MKAKSLVFGFQTEGVGFRLRSVLKTVPRVCTFRIFSGDVRQRGCGAGAGPAPALGRREPQPGAPAGKAAVAVPRPLLGRAVHGAGRIAALGDDGGRPCCSARSNPESLTRVLCFAVWGLPPRAGSAPVFPVTVCTLTRSKQQAVS